jgi:hypothetical protein
MYFPQHGEVFYFHGQNLHTILIFIIQGIGNDVKVSKKLETPCTVLPYYLSVLHLQPLKISNIYQYFLTIESNNIHTYHSRFIPKGVAEVSQIFLRDTHVLPKLVSYEEHCRRDRR